MDVILKKPRGFWRWWQLYRLYLQAFPAAERKPWAMILRMYRRGVTDIWCLEKDGAFAGLAITINDSSTQAHLGTICGKLNSVGGLSVRFRIVTGTGIP